MPKYNDFHLDLQSTSLNTSYKDSESWDCPSDSSVSGAPGRTGNSGIHHCERE